MLAPLVGEAYEPLVSLEDADEDAEVFLSGTGVLGVVEVVFHQLEDGAPGVSLGVELLLGEFADEALGEQ